MQKYQRIHDLSPLSLKLLNDQIEELWRTVMIKFDEVEKQALADLIEQNNDLSGFLLEAEADRDR